jgi:hypothetical protein
MKLLLVLVFALICLVSADPQVSIQAVSGSEVNTGTKREYTIVASPSFAAPDAFAVRGVKISVSNQNVKVDAAQVGFSNPALSSSSNLGFYFGKFSADASISSSAGPNIVPVSGALAEIGAIFTVVFVWLDNNGQPGFQAIFPWDCNSAAANQDCIVSAYDLALNNLTWSTISHANYSCPAASGYTSDCQVHVFSTSGSYQGSSVITFDLKLASQPVLVDQVEVTPDYGEIDITINYPWAAMGVTQSTAHVGLAMASAGKAAHFTGTISQVNNKNAYVFDGSGASTYIAWNGSATVGSSQSPVYVQGISGSEITGYTCPITCSLAARITLAAYQVAVSVWQNLGWQVQITFFSWQDNQPASVFWDPSIGTSTSLGSVQSAPLAFVAGSALLL